MPLDRPRTAMLNPLTQETNAHIIVATGSRHVFVNGQIARDSAGDLVGAGDLHAQIRQCWVNVRAALAAVGASGLDVVMYRMYVVDPEEGQAGRLTEIGREVFGDQWPIAPAVFLGVTALGRADYLVEIEAQAVLD